MLASSCALMCMLAALLHSRVLYHLMNGGYKMGLYVAHKAAAGAAPTVQSQAEHWAQGVSALALQLARPVSLFKFGNATATPNGRQYHLSSPTREARQESSSARLLHNKHVQDTCRGSCGMALRR